MAYKALYRTYRPNDFESMAGQKHIVTTLKNAIENNKIAHAYIFSGPRGTGKTTTAKLLAKAVNCLSEEGKPCNCCENCVAINENTFADIIEIDAASNNGVDEVRELIEKVKYAPIKGKYKVYIIDEVHMMTAGAFNALLKTLEEPPAHVIFILATTDIHRVIPTVLSRCQRFDFNKISYDDIKEKVEEIMKKEAITAEEGVSSLIAELADGGMRDALSTLDQLISYARNDLKLQHIYDIYGMMSASEMVHYLSLISSGKTNDVLELIEQYIEKGIDVRRLTYDLMICLKDAVVYSSTSDEKVLERLNKQQASDVLKHYNVDKALAIIDIFNEANGFYRQTSNYRLFFELASLKAIAKIGLMSGLKKTFPSAPTTTEEEMMEEQSVFRTIVEEKPQPVVEPKVEINLEPVKETEKTVETPIKEEPIRTSSINVPHIKDEYGAPETSPIIQYSMDDYINIVAHGDKKFKYELIEQWSKIREYLNYDKTRYIAQLIVDATVGAASNEFCVLVYNHRILSERAKEQTNLLLIRKFLKEIFGYDFEIFVVDHGTFVDITNRYMQLLQAHKKPELRDIPRIKNYVSEAVIAKAEPVTNQLEDKTIEIGRNFFGDMLKIKKEN